MTTGSLTSEKCKLIMVRIRIRVRLFGEGAIEVRLGQFTNHLSLW